MKIMETISKYLLVLGIVAVMETEALATQQHVVGGSQGWDESTDFTSWASAQTFKVGDQLVFKYSGLHSVVELGGESAYKSCDIGSTLKTMNGGNNVVKLDKPGTRYFACGTSGHCGAGMKVKITTAAGDGSHAPTSYSSSSSSTPSPTSSTSTSSTPPLTSSVSALHLSVFFNGIVAFLVLNMFFFVL